jgi:hypothetical protein
MELEALSQFSHKPAICPHPKPDKSSPLPPIIFLLHLMDGKVQSITTIFYFISYERESIAKLQFSTTYFGLFGHHQVVLLPV